VSDTTTREFHLSDEQRIDWLRLIRSENVGPRTFHMLVGRYGSARAALDALPALARRGGASGIRVHSRADAERELTSATRRGVAYVAVGERNYPVRLQSIDDPPPLISVRGKIEDVTGPMVAIVGSRNASAVGIKFAAILARELGEAGFVIVSGLARGIDAAAHRASIATGTVAVLAGGHDHIYPPEHIELLNALLVSGAAITEMPLEWAARSRDFPRRNRLISGLAVGVVIVEAAKRSGSLITARFALEQGREVFAVPGSPLEPRAEGTNGLIKQGAALVTETSDIISVLAPIIGRRLDQPSNVTEPELPAAPEEMDTASAEARTRILGLLGATPVELDDLVRLSGAPAGLVRTLLLELELAGRIVRENGRLILGPATP
jgi:DNA processing protein